MTPLASRDKEYSINLEISKIHVIIDSDKCYGKDDLKRKKKKYGKRVLEVVGIASSDS